MSSIQTMIERRERLLGPGNPLFYDEPVHLVSGEGVWLTDADGRRYLDCYNNVPCVGHCHPRVVAALCEQAGKLNTHTRYLDENLLVYAENLLSRFDDSLDRVALACTGSEANDLALRIARFNTGGEGFICTNATYHGNTAAVFQLCSIFKPFEGYGPAVRMVDWPDTYRAPAGLSGEALADHYADQVQAAIRSFDDAGIGFAGMLVCPIFANEGLPDLPPGYLDKAIAYVREAGGLYVADEVQSGFGRTGEWWGHTGGSVVPDLLTLGKPMGAGHPISAVVARGELLDNFRRSEMYFNTYGGNPVSCAVGNTVLQVIDDENLVDNAAATGDSLLAAFRGLADRHPVIGDVRGRGLFFGIDLVDDRATKAPAAGTARRVVNAMRQRGVLMSKIGEHDNVLKIRPPLCFGAEHTEILVNALDECLAELDDD